MSSQEQLTMITEDAVISVVDDEYETYGGEILQ